MTQSIEQIYKEFPFFKNMTDKDIARLMTVLIQGMVELHFKTDEEKDDLIFSKLLHAGSDAIREKRK